MNMDPMGIQSTMRQYTANTFFMNYIININEIVNYLNYNQMGNTANSSALVELDKNYNA